MELVGRFSIAGLCFIRAEHPVTFDSSLARSPSLHSQIFEPTCIVEEQFELAVGSGSVKPIKPATPVLVTYPAMGVFRRSNLLKFSDCVSAPGRVGNPRLAI
jgi:hypothetical protein